MFFEAPNIKVCEFGGFVQTGADAKVTPCSRPPPNSRRKGSSAPAKVVPHQAQNWEKISYTHVPRRKNEGWFWYRFRKNQKAQSFLGFRKKTVLEYEALLIAAGFKKQEVKTDC
jgi:hypothetical protein